VLPEDERPDEGETDVPEERVGAEYVER